MGKEPRENRIPFMMSDSELEAVDEWRFANRIATRAEAIRRLCHMALTIEANQPKIKQRLQKVAAGSDDARKRFERWEMSILEIEDEVLRDQMDEVADAALESMASMFSTLEYVLGVLEVAAYFRTDHEIGTVLRDVEAAKKRLQKRLERMERDE